MNSFLSNPQKTIGSEEIEYTATKRYIELEIPTTDKNRAMYIYEVFQPNNTLLILACLDNLIDKIISNLNESNESSLSIVCKSWPTLIELYQNGRQGKYSTGALIRRHDEDTGDLKYFVATIVGNIDYYNVDELCSDRVDKAESIVIDKTKKMLKELMNNKPNYTMWAATDTFSAIKNNLPDIIKIISKIHKKCNR